MAGLTTPGIDYVEFEVIRNALLTLAAEMKVVTTRASHSPAWREAGDMSCALLDAHGELVAQGPADLPIHLATMPYSVRGALDAVDPHMLVPGDLLFMNDPLAGNNHLPDCLVINPVFADGWICAYTVVRGHWPDIGGAIAGGYTTLTTDPIQEGLRIPPLRLWREGELDREIADLIFANVRGREQRYGDLLAQYAGCQVGAARFLELVDKHGVGSVLATMDEILDRGERLTRAEIARIPDGEYEAVTELDGDGLGDDLLRIRARVVVDGERMLVDLTGSSPQVRGGMNSPPAVGISAVHCAVKIATDPTAPSNSGCYRSIEVVAPEGTIVNPRLPAPVIGGNVETASRIVETVLTALGQVVPERVMAAGCGSALVTVIAGHEERRDSDFIFLESNGGVWGARYNKDGINATRVGVGNTGNTPVEVIETEYPVRIEAYELVPDAGGPGRFRGGVPTRRTYRMLTDVEVTITGDSARAGLRGMAGGEPGSVAEYVVDRETPDERRLFSKVGPLALAAGQTLTVQGPGGGGFGPPRERDASLVERDVREGYVSPAAARDAYGASC